MEKIGLWLVVGLVVFMLLKPSSPSSRSTYPAGYDPYGQPLPGPSFYSSPDAGGIWGTINTALGVGGGILNNWLNQPPGGELVVVPNTVDASD